MPYVRISLMKPLAGQSEDVAQLNRELVAFYRTQKGCLACYYLTAVDESGETGRVTIWEQEADADQAASQDHSMALRSKLHLLVQPGHSERSFLAE